MPGTIKQQTTGLKKEKGQMKKYILSLAVMTVMLFVTGSAFAAITVVSVKGTAAYSVGRKWAPLNRGMQLKEGTKISTGVRSSVVLRLNRSTVTVRALSMMKVYEDSASAGSSSTRIGLRRGNLRAEVTKGKKVKTIFRIATPVATSSVRGTIEEADSGFYGAIFEAPQGSFDVVSRNGQHRVVYGNLAFNQRRGYSQPDAMRRSRSTKIFDPNITGDEQQGQELFGSDVPDGPGGASDFVNDFLGAGGDAEVNIIIEWPAE